MIEEWIIEMMKEIQGELKQESTDTSQVTLSDEQMNKLADIMIKKMSEPSVTDDNTGDDKVTDNQVQESEVTE